VEPAERQKSIRREQRVEIEFLEQVLRRCPGHEQTLEALGHLYTKAGRYEEGLRIDLEMTRRQPGNPEHWYNLACSFALVKRPDDAINALDRAIHQGYRDAAWLLKDQDLKPLHSDPRFEKLVARVKQS
jgi:predicted Zn-dependent protease